MDENVVNVPSQAPRTNIWFLVLGVLVVIFLILVGFLYFQTKKVAPITSNTTTTNAPNNSIVNIPKSSNDPTSEPLYTFNCLDLPANVASGFFLAFRSPGVCAQIVNELSVKGNSCRPPFPPVLSY